MKPERSKVFDETYQNYLKEICSLDFLAKAESLGVELENHALRIPLFNTWYLFGDKGLTAETGDELTPAIQVMICKYILTTPEQLPTLDSTLATYREFKDSGPLISYFTNNTNKTLEQNFRGNVTGLREKVVEVGGEILPSDGYDVSARFFAFPRIPVLLNFNDADDMFPAACSILYQKSAAVFLDMECLAMTGTLLAGKLLK